MGDKMEAIEISEIIDNLKQKRGSFHSSPCQTDEEFLVIADIVQKCNHLHGEFAEIGAYEGFTSEFILRLKNKDKAIFLCDTFEGLADVGDEDKSLCIPNGLLGVDFQRFNSTNDFCNNQNVFIIKGYFPESATEEMNRSRYAFVHIDTDTYLSTLKSLEYFYPKMVNGGIIIVHDYRNHTGTLGVKKAVDSFMIDKEDALSTRGDTTQGIITKI